MRTRRHTPMLASLLAIAAVGGFSSDFGGGFPVYKPTKRDPERPKTPADLEAMAKAEEKRARKRAAKGLPHP